MMACIDCYAQQADIIIINAAVSVMDDSNTEAQAVAVKDGKVLVTGTNDRVLKSKGKNTRVVDAKGRRVIPGLFDSHLHVIRGGRFFNTELRWDGVKSLRRALEMLKEQASRTPPGQWVRVVGGWNEFQFDEKRLPTLDEINNATGTTPTFILYLYGKAWVNKAGLEKLGISAETPNPDGGLIEKNVDGNPTGLLLAEPNAFILYSTLSKLPELSDENKFNSTIQYMTELNSLGVTAVMDAGGGFQNYPEDYRIMDSLHRLGKIALHLPYFVFAQKKGMEKEDFNRWITMTGDIHKSANGVNSVEYYLSGAGENLVADAGDFENFLFPRPEFPVTMESKLKAVIQLLVQRRWPFRLHATYNESITRDLNVIEEVNRETPLNGLVWFFDHAETVSEENMQRIKALGGGIAIQHRMAYQAEHFIRRYGKLAAANAPPVKRMLELGIPVGLGTDGTRVAGYNPWIALYWITTGKTIGGTAAMAQQNILDRNTALRLMTSGGYSLIRDSLRGKLLKGYTADLVMLSEDYLNVSDEKIKEIRSVLTIVGGRIVYAAEHYKTLSPARPEILPDWSPVRYFGGYQYESKQQ
jgi:predicted amidohydrolase YtcJ